MPYKKSPMKKSSCIKMYDKKGKPSGLMMEGSAMHMESAGSPAKQIDEREGERDEFGTVIPKGFSDDTRPYDLTSEGMGKGQYDPEEASRIFTGAQSQVQNALDLAGRQLGGEEVFNSMLKGGYGARSLTGPQAAQVITGYSSGEKGQETVGGTGKVRFNKKAVQNKLNELNKLAITDPVAAKKYVSNRLSGAPLGDDTSRFNRDIDPLKRN